MAVWMAVQRADESGSDWAVPMVESKADWKAASSAGPRAASSDAYSAALSVA